MISDTTGIALGVVGSMIATTCGATWIIARIIMQIRTELHELKQDHFGLAVASEQALRMAIENPGMRVPDPRSPSRVIVVENKKELRQ